MGNLGKKNNRSLDQDKNKDPDALVLQKLFQDYPELLPNKKEVPQDGEKLRKLAERIWREMRLQVKEKKAQDAFIGQLHSNMVKTTGLLGIVNTMLQAAKNNENARWEVYRGYACQQLRELQELAQKIGKKSPRNSKKEQAERQKAKNFSAEELTERIRRQIRLLKEPPAQTEYLPLYESIKMLPIEKPAADLSAWFCEASDIMKAGMEKLEPELRAAIREEYAYL